MRKARTKAHLVDLIDPKIHEHHGRIVKTTGDGVLPEIRQRRRSGRPKIDLAMSNK